MKERMRDDDRGHTNRSSKGCLNKDTDRCGAMLTMLSHIIVKLIHAVCLRTMRLINFINLYACSCHRTYCITIRAAARSLSLSLVLSLSHSLTLQHSHSSSSLNISYFHFLSLSLSLSPAGPCGAFLLEEGKGSELALRAAVAERQKRGLGLGLAYSSALCCIV